MAHATREDGSARAQFGRAPRKTGAPGGECLKSVEFADAQREIGESLRAYRNDRRCVAEEPLLPEREDVEILREGLIADPRTPDGRDRSSDLLDALELGANRGLLGLQTRHWLFDEPLRRTQQLLERDEARKRGRHVSKRPVMGDGVERVGNSSQQKPVLRAVCERSQRAERGQRQGAIGHSGQRKGRKDGSEEAHENALRRAAEPYQAKLQVLAQRGRLLERAHRARTPLQGADIVRRRPEPLVKCLLSGLGQRTIELLEQGIEIEVGPGRIVDPQRPGQGGQGADGFEVAPSQRIGLAPRCTE